MKQLLILIGFLFIGCSTDPKSIYGCTDETAANFNINANIYDNSCEYDNQEQLIKFPTYLHYYYSGENPTGDEYERCYYSLEYYLPYTINDILDNNICSNKINNTTHSSWEDWIIPVQNIMHFTETNIFVLLPEDNFNYSGHEFREGYNLNAHSLSYYTFDYGY